MIVFTIILKTHIFNNAIKLIIDARSSRELNLPEGASLTTLDGTAFI